MTCVHYAHHIAVCWTRVHYNPAYLIKFPFIHVVTYIIGNVHTGRI